MLAGVIVLLALAIGSYVCAASVSITRTELAAGVDAGRQSHVRRPADILSAFPRCPRARGPGSVLFDPVASLLLPAIVPGDSPDPRPKPAGWKEWPSWTSLFPA